MQPIRTKGKTGFSRKTALLVSVAVLLALSAALYFLLRPAEPAVTGEDGKEQAVLTLLDHDDALLSRITVHPSRSDSYTLVKTEAGWILEGEYAGNCWEPGNQPEIVLGLMNEYDKDFLGHYGFSRFAEFVNPPIELAPYGEAWQIDYSPVDVEHQDFCDIQDKELPELIMCDPADFDALWDKFIEDITPSAKVFEDYMQEHVLIEAQKVLNK